MARNPLLSLLSTAMLVFAAAASPARAAQIEGVEFVDRIVFASASLENTPGENTPGEGTAGEDTVSGEIPPPIRAVRHAEGGDASAATVATAASGAAFGDAVSREVTLDLWNVGLLRWKIFFKGYVAALYVGEGGTVAAVSEDKPKRLELHYFYSIAGNKFGGAADELLGRWMSPQELAPLRQRLDALHALYRDVSPGDRYALTYVPGVGTELALNNEPLGVIEGADFAGAYFSIWLGAVPLDESLRDQLLAPPGSE